MEAINPDVLFSGKKRDHTLKKTQRYSKPAANTTKSTIAPDLDTDLNIKPMKVLPQSKIFQSKRNFHVQYRQNILNILNAFPYIKQKHPLDYNRVLKFIGNDNDYAKTTMNELKDTFDIAGALLKHLLAFQVMNHTETMCLRNVKKHA